MTEPFITPSLSTMDLVELLSAALDLVDPAVVQHQKQVAYASYRIATTLGWPSARVDRLLMAALLHDIGAFSLAERLRLLEFDVKDTDGHADKGARLLNLCPALADLAPLVRHHHAPWDQRDILTAAHGNPVPEESFIIHLADRLSVMAGASPNILDQRPTVISHLQKLSGSIFAPHLLGAFEAAAARESFWLDLLSPDLHLVNRAVASLNQQPLPLDQQMPLLRFAAQSVDFRTAYTRCHSTDVAAVAVALGRLAGMDGPHLTGLEAAGLLHDLGKFAVPSEVLEKDEPLNWDENAAYMAHPYYTHKLLENLRNFDTINHWASLHHERLDASGFPFHLPGDSMDLGDRIMQVADLWVSCHEQRPFRRMLHREEVMTFLQRQAEQRKIDAALVTQAVDNRETLYAAMEENERRCREDFARVWES